MKSSTYVYRQISIFYSVTCLDQLVSRLSCEFLLRGGRLARDPKQGSHCTLSEMWFGILWYGMVSEISWLYLSEQI